MKKLYVIALSAVVFVPLVMMTSVVFISNEHKIEIQNRECLARVLSQRRACMIKNYSVARNLGTEFTLDLCSSIHHVYDCTDITKDSWVSDKFRKDLLAFFEQKDEDSSSSKLVSDQLNFELLGRNSTAR